MVPPETPVTTPAVLTVPTAGVLLLHVLPAVGGVTLNVVVDPAHTVIVPVSGGGIGVGLTVTMAVTSHVPTV